MGASLIKDTPGNCIKIKEGVTNVTPSFYYQNLNPNVI